MVVLAVEDAVLESIACRILADYRHTRPTSVLQKRGCGYLKNKARSLNHAAGGVDVLLLTDLDRPGDCPVELIDKWLGGPPQPRMMFRVAVVEAETWLLADQNGLAQFLAVPPGRLGSQTGNVEDIQSPKEHLISAARKSTSRTIRDGIPPPDGGTSSIGPLYNSLLADFVGSAWDPEVARHGSVSLDRAIRRLERP